MMKLLAPVNSYESAEKVISAGANEIYFGIDDDVFNTYSFTGRGKYTFNEMKVLCSFNEAKKIISYAHSNNVLVNFLCNTQFITDNDKGVFEKALLEHIEKAISIKVDSVVIGDIGLLYLLRQRNYNVPIHASLYFRTVNVDQLKFLREYNVVRATLSYSVTIDDIQQLVSSNIMEIEVPGYLGCSFYNGACNCLHSLGEGVFDAFDPGIICKSNYIVDDGKHTQHIKLFDNEMACSLCCLGELNFLGVSALKIVGRDRNCNNISEVVDLYKKALEGKFSKNNIPKSWELSWCRGKRCKFINEERLQYYI